MSTPLEAASDRNRERLLETAQNDKEKYNLKKTSVLLGLFLNIDHGNNLINCAKEFESLGEYDDMGAEIVYSGAYLAIFKKEVRIKWKQEAHLQPNVSLSQVCADMRYKGFILGSKVSDNQHTFVFDARILDVPLDDAVPKSDDDKQIITDLVALIYRASRDLGDSD